MALVDAALGYRVRRATYRAAADIADNLASRDLKQLVDADLLVAHGEKRGLSYSASDLLRSIAAPAREPRRVEDPFGEGAA